MKNNLTEKHEKALNKFVKEQKKNQNVIGLLLSGSFVHSKPDKNSDLDVVIITKDSKFRERGNTWINGVEVEYFNNPVKQIRHYFKKEIGSKSPYTAHMLANSKILYQKDQEIYNLVREAKKILQKPQKRMNKFEVENARYMIDDLEKDLEDVCLKKDYFAFKVISSRISVDCLNIFYRINKISPEKPKRLISRLEEIDIKFSQMYSKVLLSKNIQEEFKNSKILIRYVEKMLGGKRPKEWKLKSRCEV